MKFTHKIHIISISLIAALLFSLGISNQVGATTLLTVSPPSQKISLIPGETTKGSLKISSPNRSDGTGKYKVSVSPFTIDDSDNSAQFTANGDYNQIVDWITLDWEEGELEPNQSVEVTFSIKTPRDAPAGGQYAAIMVSSVNDNVEENAVNIQNNYQIAHLIYADVAGQTTRGGKIGDVSLPGFLFSGNITASTSITNDGNVHSYATHILRVLPLFGDEEYYTNEEEPTENLIMPEATRYTSISWDDTPNIGIFRVNYIVEYEGVKKEVSKMVIVCPLWLLFIIALILALIIIKIVLGRKKKA